MDDDLVYFTCVKVGSRLRVRITSPGYQNDANCQFPRAIRVENGRYRAPSSAITLAKGPAGKYFYRVKRTSIEPVQEKIEKIYKTSDDCVACMDSSPEVAIIPCGHFCLCVACGDKLRRKDMCCPMCRGKISQMVTEDQIQVFSIQK